MRVNLEEVPCLLWREEDIINSTAPYLVNYIYIIMHAIITEFATLKTKYSLHLAMRTPSQSIQRSHKALLFTSNPLLLELRRLHIRHPTANSTLQRTDPFPTWSVIHTTSITLLETCFLVHLRHVDLAESAINPVTTRKQGNV